MSQTERTFLIVGFSNVIFTLLFLNYYKSSIFKNNLIIQSATFVVILLISFGINFSLNNQAGSFFSPMQVWMASVIFAILNWLVIYAHAKKAFQIAFFLLCLAFLIPNLSINPLSRSLAPYYENRVFKLVAGIEAKDPGARWLVFGKYTIPDYLKGTGINCISGVQFAPPFEKLKLLDPQMKYDSVYNRYAHVAFTSFIDGKDSIEFKLLAPDVYTINMDPCSPRLYQMGIKYFMFTYQPQPVEVEYMTPVANDSGYYIFKRNEE
jgi:hypothetical protein